MTNIFGCDFDEEIFLKDKIQLVEGSWENAERRDAIIREGNGRSTRIWLDLMLKKNLKMCVDWSKINKKDYLSAMEESSIDSSHIKQLLENALTDKINDRETFMKGIDYSYYYEEAE